MIAIAAYRPYFAFGKAILLIRGGVADSCSSNFFSDILLKLYLE